ncbi:hypothetical protein [Pacificispira sp.]|uniref:hypothetical protein n=1 Tax=Pacificispira sp. TaxID=2888761 RepID=UPI003BADBBF2
MDRLDRIVSKLSGVSATPVAAVISAVAGQDREARETTAARLVDMHRRGVVRIEFWDGAGVRVPGVRRNFTSVNGSEGMGTDHPDGPKPQNTEG